MSKHDEFEKIYSEYKIRTSEFNKIYYDERKYAVRKFNAIVHAAKTTQCRQYDRETMLGYFKNSGDQKREILERRDVRQNALNQELARSSQAIGVYFR